MKIKYYFLISLIIIGCVRRIHAECCYHEWVAFFIKNNSAHQCSDYGAVYNSDCGITSLCQIGVCGDGAVGPNWFCGVGDCNVFGCNCDFGCITGNPYENFQKIHGGDDIIVLH